MLVVYVLKLIAVLRLLVMCSAESRCVFILYFISTHKAQVMVIICH